MARAATIFSVKERAALLQSLALPHLDMCQTALATQWNGRESAATRTLRRAYNRAARVAKWGKPALHRYHAGPPGSAPPPILRSAPALESARWRTWAQRRAAVRAAFTARIFETGEPEVLRALLRGVTSYASMCCELCFEVLRALLRGVSSSVSECYERGVANSVSRCHELCFEAFGALFRSVPSFVSRCFELCSEELRILFRGVTNSAS